jgi:hypothetical protein
MSLEFVDPDHSPRKPPDSAEVLMGIRRQNQTIIEQNREIAELLKKISSASKQTARSMGCILAIVLALILLSIVFCFILYQAGLLREFEQHRQLMPNAASGFGRFRGTIHDY